MDARAGNVTALQPRLSFPAGSEPVSDGECQQIRQFNGYSWPRARLITHAGSPASTPVLLKGVDRRRVSATCKCLVYGCQVRQFTLRHPLGEIYGV